MSQGPYPHLAFSNGRFLAEQRRIEIDPRHLAITEYSKVQPVREPAITPVIADSARANVITLGKLGGSSQRFNHRPNVAQWRCFPIHDDHYSCRLKIVKWLERELISRGFSGTMGGMAREPLNVRSVDAIAARLEATRRALGINQTELCRRAGLGKNTYNQWERAKGRPELDQAMKLCDTFALTLDWIYRGDPSGLPYSIASNITDLAS